MEVVMDALHSGGISIVTFLQQNFMSFQDWFIFVSHAAELKSTFYIFFPIWFHICESVGTKLIWVAVIGDWLNLVFKWILFGQRPYWWVHETFYYSDGLAPEIKQFPVTCETGPGSPSGHAMGSAAVGYVMVCALQALAHNHSSLKTWCQRWVLWTVFWGIQINVCLSRVFVAAHFPHQVVSGIISGILVAKVFNHMQVIYKLSLKEYIYTTMFLFFFATGFYLSLMVFDVDLLWTIDKAKHWCARVEWIHIDSTPFAGLIRNLGIFLGLGLALASDMYKRSCKAKCGPQFLFRLTCIVTSLFILHFYDSFELPSQLGMIFYVLCFIKSLAVPLIAVSLVPYCVSYLVKGQDQKSFQKDGDYLPKKHK
ncbi:glucose-6-phosphatase catalytic subunit 1-like [Gastrophryne carolinensis]